MHLRNYCMAFQHTHTYDVYWMCEPRDSTTFKMANIVTSLATYFRVDGKRHDEDGDHDVGDGERDDEVVGQRSQLFLAVDTQTHEEVTEHCEQREDEQQERPVAKFRSIL